MTKPLPGLPQRWWQVATLVDADRDNPGSVAGGVERDEGRKRYHGLVGVK